jgi:hypothetical protein
MKKVATMAVLPLFGGFLWAQATETTTTTTTTTLNGTLVDAACRTTHTEHKTTTTTNPDENTTRTQTTKTNTESTECPVTTTTTTFGLVTPEGHYVTFDEPSNTKVVEIVKNNKAWTRYVNNREPIKVRVVGNKRGDVVVVESIK